MRILGLETSGYSGSVALAEGNQLVAQIILPEKQRTAQGLAPAIAQLLETAGWRSQQIQLVAVTAGPGSFTGLRVGVMSAKTFAYAVDAEVLAVDTLDVIAQQAPALRPRISVVIDAQRNQLFEATFEHLPSDGWRRLTATHILDDERWISWLQEECRTSDWLVSGSSLTKLGNRLPPGIPSVELANWQPLAATVCAVAWRDYQTGRRDDLWKLAPDYYRPSAAEEQAKK